jgi:hypothetical protein
VIPFLLGFLVMAILLALSGVCTVAAFNAQWHGRYIRAERWKARGASLCYSAFPASVLVIALSLVWSAL